MSTKRKLAAKLGQPTLKASAKLPGKSTVDESRTVVLGAGRAPTTKASGLVEISNSSAEDEDDEEEELSEEEDDVAEEEPEDLDEEPSQERESESAAEAADVSMDDAPEAAEGEPAEPSFGDLVRANASEPIDVVGAFDAASPGDEAYPKAVQVQPPSGASLGTVLSQALRTNDVSMLESCLHTTDLNTIRATIQRLDSPLAGTLLQKLAERLHRRPGRAGSLMVWVQWTLVTHGGYLATQKDLVKKLAELNRVLDERAKGLQSLLSLKGKLDMLEAQMEMRRAMQSQRRQAEEDDDEEDVIYVEGEESEEEEGKEGETEMRKPKRLARNGDLEDISDGESEVSEDMPLANGVGDSEDEESESSEDDDDDNLIDDEAEETDEDEADENEVDHDDQDEEVEDEESDEAGAPPPKMQRTALSSRKR